MEIFLENISLEIVFFLIGAGFLSALIDSMVGGGGLISLPALLLAGLPPTVALGTNKLAAFFGVFSASATFWQKGFIQRDLIYKLFLLSLSGAACGAWVVSQIPPLYLEPLIITVLAMVTVFVSIHKNWGSVSTYERSSGGMLFLSSVFSFGIGFYDGFIGPGTGTFFLFAFIWRGFDFLQAAGNSRILNLASNLGALILFLILGKVNIFYGLIMAIGMVVGGYTGARLAILKGSGFVRIVFLLVTTILIGKLAYNYFFI